MRLHGSHFGNLQACTTVTVLSRCTARYAMILESIPTCLECGARPGTLVEALSHTDIEQLSNAKRCIQFNRHEALFRAGQFPAGLFCVHSGHIKVSREFADGTEHIVRLAKTGSVLGYRSLISGLPYTTSAYALDPSTVCIIPRDTVMRLLNTNKSVCLQFLNALSTELEQSEEATVRLARKSVRERLAETLLILAETFGTSPVDQSIAGELTREELASIVGTTPESVMRRLSELRHENIIATDGRHIRIVDREALISAACLHD